MQLLLDNTIDFAFEWYFLIVLLLPGVRGSNTSPGIPQYQKSYKLLSTLSDRKLFKKREKGDPQYKGNVKNGEQVLFSLAPHQAHHFQQSLPT